MIKKRLKARFFIYIFFIISAAFSRDVAASSGSPKGILTNQQADMSESRRIRSAHQSYGLIYNRGVRLKLLLFDIL